MEGMESGRETEEEGVMRKEKCCWRKEEEERGGTFHGAWFRLGVCSISLHHHSTFLSSQIKPYFSDSFIKSNKSDADRRLN